AEAVRDLIEASTLNQARVAARQLGGALSRQVAPVKERLVALIAGLEAGVDFAEDDIETMPAEEIAERIAAVEAPLRGLERGFEYGRIVHD
ncbi:tRNA uridine-5-carboxymethylaminomethyl(34) synthesis GTPase MnmE, partial [Pseudomonas sp. MPR-R2A5]